MISGKATEAKTSPEEKPEDARASLLQKLRIILDIDGTLGTSVMYVLVNPDKKAKIDQIQKMKDYIEKNSAISDVNQLQTLEFDLQKNGFDIRVFFILHPGAIELVKWLDLSGILSALFSATYMERNQRFADEFFPLALGTVKYNAIKNSLTIKSENDLTQCNKFYDILRQSALYGLPCCPGPAPRMKSLNIEPFKQHMDHAVLADNMSYNIAIGEEKNSLITDCEVEIEDFCLDFANNTKNMKEILKLNNVFRIVGVLKTAIEMTLENKKPFLDNLFSLQFEAVHPGLFQQGTVKYKPRECFKQESMKFYEIGLRELQKINPNLTIYGGSLLRKLVEEEILVEKSMMSMSF